MEAIEDIGEINDEEISGEESTSDARYVRVKFAL